MPFAASDLNTLLLYDDKTITYYLPDGKPICMGYIRKDPSRYCQQPAGWKTEHPGTGKCYLHGGNTVTAYPKPGFKPNASNRYQRALPKKMQDTFERFYNDPNLLDLTPELTLLKTMLESFILGCNEEALESPEVIAFAAGLANSIGKMIGQIDKIQSNQVLTFASARLMMTRAVDVASHYIPQEQMKQFVMEWKAALQIPGLLEAPSDTGIEAGDNEE